MHRLLAVLLAAAGLAAGPATGGTVTGVVTAHGPAIPHQGGAAGAYSSLRYKFAEQIDYDRLDDFVIYINAPVPGAPARRVTAAMSQRSVAFEPHVLAIPVNTAVIWPNLDSIYHNVFSMSDAKVFDLGLKTNKDRPEEVTFDRPGRVDVFCSIHARMHGIILVVPSPFVAKVSARHRYTIADVPAGTYPLRAWQERLPPMEKTVTVPAVGTVEVDFDLGFSSLPRP
ncbi:MAG TPA: plastocyanin/azurin family copper-binding protein [Opitutaceae bacterium]|jgi:plastocyanin|nr:plastocyanin/azurin family copper-binding protein [Opitutaceae bacterium]